MTWFNRLVRVVSDGETLIASFNSPVPPVRACGVYRRNPTTLQGPDTAEAHLQVLTMAAWLEMQERENAT